MRLDGTAKLILINAFHHLLLLVAEIVFAAVVHGGARLGLVSQRLTERVEVLTYWFVLLTLGCLCLTSLMRILIRSVNEVRREARTAAAAPREG